MERDFVNELRQTPIEPKNGVDGYKLWEPENGWPPDFGDIALEMARRGYVIQIVPFNRFARRAK